MPSGVSLSGGSRAIDHQTSRREHPLVCSCPYVFVRCRVQAECYSPVAGAERQKHNEHSSGMLGISFLSVLFFRRNWRCCLTPRSWFRSDERTLFNLVRQGALLLFPCRSLPKSPSGRETRGGNSSDQENDGEEQTDGSRYRHFRLRIGGVKCYNHVSGVFQRTNASASAARRTEFSVGTG